MPTEGLVQTAYTQPRRTRPRPGRRRNIRHHIPFSLSCTFTFAVLLLLSCCCSSTYAADAGTRATRHQLRSSFVTEEILFDDRPVPAPALFRRAEASSIVAPTRTRSNHAAASSTASPSSAETSIESAPAASAPPPRPFDGGLGINYTQPSCPIFLKAMISNDSFTSCQPFSLLVQNSMSFFTTSKSWSTMTSCLDKSCAVDFPACSSLMSSFARTLRSTAGCEQDYGRENPIVRQAYAGLVSYDVLYHASCLKNTSSPVSSTATTSSSAPSSDQDDPSSAYCFANAITNFSSPTDSYIYHLPLGIPLPASSLPTCNSCLQNTMALYAGQAANKTQPLSGSYVDAAGVVNMHCGPGFANATVKGSNSESASGGGKNLEAGSMWFAGTVVMLTMMLLGI